MQVAQAFLSPIADTRLPPAGEAARDAARQFVGQDAALDAPLTDEAREWAIERAGALTERRYADYVTTGCFAALGDAHRAMRLQRELVMGRSKEQVRRLEIKRGLI